MRSIYILLLILATQVTLSQSRNEYRAILYEAVADIKATIFKARLSGEDKTTLSSAVDDWYKQKVYVQRTNLSTKELTLKVRDSLYDYMLPLIDEAVKKSGG
jgi:hypothetical protein